MQFDQFNTRDFAEHPGFQRWVYAPDQQTESFWQQFLVQHPEKKPDVLEAKAILSALKQTQHEPDELETAQMWQQIQGQTRPQPVVRPLYRWWPAAVAAACLLVVGLYGWFYLSSSGQPDPVLTEHTATHTQVTNGGAKAIALALPDGSRIQLQPQSRIEYPRVFGTQRTVRLEGEAFFQVTHNEQQPFEVVAGDVTTRVLGTSFTVRAFTGQSKTEVFVRTGIVWVRPMDEASALKNADGVRLVANQQATYHRQQQTLVRSLVADPVVVLADQSAQMAYRNQPVGQVLDDLQQHYGISFRYDRTLLKNCLVTMRFDDESFYERLRIVCRTLGANYQVVDGQVVITAQGC